MCFTMSYVYMLLSFCLVGIYSMNEQENQISGYEAVSQDEFAYYRSIIENLRDIVNQHTVSIQRLESKSDYQERIIESQSRENERLSISMEQCTSESVGLHERMATLEMSIHTTSRVSPKASRSEFGCFMDVLHLDCAGVGISSSITIDNAIYGKYNTTCSEEENTCCTPSQNDCTVNVAETNPDAWLALLYACTNKSECTYQYTGVIINECELGYMADYMQVDYACETKLVPQIEEPIGFTACHDGDASYIEGEIVIYNYTLSNIGDRYNPDNSTFTCPYDGMYMFSAKVRSERGMQMGVTICREDTELIETFAEDSTGIEPSSAVIVVECGEGERVYTKATYNGTMLAGFRRPHFTGALLGRL